MNKEMFAKLLAAKPAKQDLFYLMHELSHRPILTDRAESLGVYLDCLKALVQSGSAFELNEDEREYCARALARYLDVQSCRRLLPDLDRGFLRWIVKNSVYREDQIELHEAAVQITAAFADAAPDELVLALDSDSYQTSDSALERLLKLDADDLQPEILVSALEWSRGTQLIDESLHFAKLLVDHPAAAPVHLAGLVDSLYNHDWDGDDELVFSGKADAIRATAVRLILEDPHAGDEELVMVVEKSYDDEAAKIAAKFLLAPEHPDLPYEKFCVVRKVMPKLAESRLTPAFALLDELLAE